MAIDPLPPSRRFLRLPAPAPDENFGSDILRLDTVNRYTDEATLADWLTYLFKETKVPFVLMGLPHCSRSLLSNDQLRRCSSQKILLEPFGIANKTFSQIFDRLMRSIWANLPVPSALQLSGVSEQLNRIHFATNGLMGYVMTLVSTSVEITLKETRPCIDIDVLAKALVQSIWPEVHPPLNLFHRRFVNRPLTNAGEPFYGYAH